MSLKDMPDTANNDEASVDDLARRLREARLLFENDAHLARAGAAARGLKRIETSLRRPPRIGIFGEFNSGKTSLVNILIGRKALPTSVTTSERGATLLRYADQPELYAIGADGGRHRLTSAAFQKLIARPALTEIGVPFPRLRAYELVDSVGVSDPALGGLPPKRSANSYVHGAVWCTVASQAWKRSEISQWRTMPEEVRQRSLLIVTHLDAVPDPTDREKIAERIRSEAANLFRGFVMVSLSQALRAMSEEGDIVDETTLHNSGAAELEQWFAEIVTLARQSKRYRAIGASHALAERLLSAPERTPHDIAVSRLQATWTSRARRMVRDVSDSDNIAEMSVQAHIDTLVSVARGFIVYSLEPWLERRTKGAAMRSILALLPQDADQLHSLVAGLSGPDANHLLDRIVDQVAAELGEKLSEIGPHKQDRPAELPQSLKEAAAGLAAWTHSLRK